MTRKNKALFLDRDGVICPELGRYRLASDGFQLLPGIKDVVRAAKEKGYLVVVVTNQPQIAKGLLSEAELHELHNEMERLLGNTLDGIYHCPHVDADRCDCRKPKAGMLVRAAEELDIDCARSMLIGDGDKDIFAGQAVGCKTIFVKNIFKEQYLANCMPNHAVVNLLEIVPLL